MRNLVKRKKRFTVCAAVDSELDFFEESEDPEQNEVSNSPNLPG
jgi:hypothetical protein